MFPSYLTPCANLRLNKLNCSFKKSGAEKLSTPAKKGFPKKISDARSELEEVGDGPKTFQHLLVYIINLEAIFFFFYR